jgi:hypothetical protein
VIETLSAGFQIVNRIPWILGLPVLIDLLLWLGPRLSVASLTERFLAASVATVGQLGRGAGPAADTQLESFQSQVELVRGIVQTFNLVSLLALSGLSLQSAVPADRSGLGGTIEVATVTALAGLALLLILIGIALACVWLGALAQQVRDGKVRPRRLIGAAPRYWLAIVGFFCLLIVGAVALAVPLSILVAVAQLVAPPVGAFLTIFVAVAFQLAVFWSLLYLFFFTDAIVVSEVGPVRAALNSIRVVSSSFWSALGFIIITWVIMQGMGVIWGSLARAPAGQAVAILGNGYIQSGLAAASMLFYRNRITRLTSSREEAGRGTTT